jgi:hypothetical protein
MAAMTINDLVQELGGTTDLAHALGVELSTVSNWRKRARIPAEHWARIVSYAATVEKIDVTFELLARMHAKPAGPALTHAEVTE